MKANKWPLDPELEALLERGRIIRSVRDPVRTRVLARARAAMMAGGPMSPARPGPTRRLRIAIAAGVAMAVGVATAAAHHHGLQDRRQTTPPPLLGWQAPPGHLPLGLSRDDSGPSGTSVPTPSPQDPEPQPPTRSVGSQESYTAEVALLQRAQLVYSSRDFPATLMLVTKHAVRFPNGRLSEEREALRVHSLAGLGRVEDARRAAAGFIRRFPRSVLLSRIQQAAE